jgi:RNA polymerase sigma-54 factor
VKPTLQLRLGQSLTLTPQLRQAIRLLQLSSVELEAEINQALESNPLLDRPEDQPSEDPDERQQAERERDAEDPAESAAEPSQEADYAELEQDWSLSDSHAGAMGSGDGSDQDERQEARPETLGEHLIWQLGLTPLSDKDQAIGLILIDALDSDGYLRESEDALMATLASSWQVTHEEIEAVRHLIQHFDPLGVASRDLAGRAAAHAVGGHARARACPAHRARMP